MIDRVGEEKCGCVLRRLCAAKHGFPATKAVVDQRPPWPCFPKRKHSHTELSRNIFAIGKVDARQSQIRAIRASAGLDRDAPRAPPIL
jgi:hypothetical protein